MISDALVRVYCDEQDCDVVDEYHLTALAGRGNYDMRNIKRQMENDGWTEVGPGRHRCADCTARGQADD